MTTIGFLVVPMLFAYLPTAVLAGNTAAKLFTAQTWVSTACAGLLLLMSRGRSSQTLAPWAGSVLGLVVGGLLLALLSEFAVTPRIVARENLKLWHAIGSGMFLLQWVCAAVTLLKLVPKKGA